MLADIDDPASRVVVFLALAILAVPVLMRWHHPLLILSWNLAAQPALPGSPQLWALMSLLSLFFAVLNRSLSSEHQFAHVSALTRPLVVFAIVVLATAFLTGGVGLRIFGSSSVGGRGYFYILAAVAGFFALSSRGIPLERAGVYAALFFLPGVTSVVGHLAALMGPKADFVFWLFPPDVSVMDDFFVDEAAFSGMSRIGSLTTASTAVFSWLLARYGVAGVFDLARPWRLILLAATVCGMTFGGFRSALLLMVAIFSILFIVEKLWRTRLTFVLLGLGIICAVLLAGFSERLPLPVQRTFSFLPIKIDPLTRQFAESSTEWRLEMWKTVLPQVPRYLLKGKGYSYNAEDLFMAQVNSVRGGGVNYEEAAFAGDYHNGPLSVVIPFGAAGMLVFIWLMVAGARFLYTMYQDSPPELRQINAFLLALFLARVLFFFVIFGSLYGEFYQFTGILGFSVALNIAGKRGSKEQAEPSVQAEAEEKTF